MTLLRFSLSSLLLFACGDDALSVQDAGATLDARADVQPVDAATDAASADAGGEADAGPIDRENPTWTDASHGKVEPDYEAVFGDGLLHRIDLAISTENWAAMQADLAENLGGGGPGMGADLDFTPIWSEATLTFDGAAWNHVGIRYKGNSSLQSASRRGGKYPFKLDFDEWEESYPAVDNQRFFGFKQLNLSSNYNDLSFMREKVASDLFLAYGVPAPRTAFCELYLDRGDGPEFMGVYTLVEEIDDTAYETQFVSDEGNLYKPDGDAASFALGTFDEAEMDLKTNEEAADYSDVRALYDVLHDARRTEDPVAWATALEEVFDVDGFLRYLAVNQVIQNWDTYGQMTHNYFLYQDEGTLHWIAWDNNESLTSSGPRAPLSLGLSEVGENWPLIRYIIDIDAYRTRYEELMQGFVTAHFNAENMNAIYAAHASTLEAAAARETAQFAGAVEELRTHVASREALVEAL
ncbi:MAG: spore coat protein H [Polyangiales bacterium]|jgi:spore coat protein H